LGNDSFSLTKKEEVKEMEKQITVATVSDAARGCQIKPNLCSRVWIPPRWLSPLGLNEGLALPCSEL